MDELKNNEKNKQINGQTEEELFFHDGKYYSRGEFFDPEEDEHNPAPKRKFKWIKITVTLLITIALISNILALWPKLYNTATIQFLKISHELSKNEDVQLYKKSVVVVRAGNKKGTGFYFSSDGLIMTNNHVIENESMINVTFQDGKSYAAKLVKGDSKIDIATLKINADELVYPVLEFEEKWETDQPIYIIGNPIFSNFIANKGHILGLISGKEVPLLMIDAPVYKGNSGSPVINHDGKVVGVVFATSTVNYDGAQKKIGLVIPVTYIINDFLNGLNSKEGQVD